MFGKVPAIRDSVRRVYSAQCAAGAGPALPRDKNNLINLHPNEWDGEVLGVGCVGNCINCDSHSMFIPDTHSTHYPGPAEMVSVQDIQFSGINI